MRIERLWGASPPTPVWPGSAQAALIFVGLPLLTALVLLATPLHDAGPPPPREETAAPAAEVPAPEPRVAEGATGPAALPRTVVRRQRVADAVPPVIYETPRRRERARPTASGSAPAVTAVTLARPAPAAQPTRLASAAASLEARTPSVSLPPQSP